MTASEIMYNLETEILKNIVEMVASGNDAGVAWKVNKLQQLNTLNAMNIEAVKKDLPKAIQAAQLEIERRSMVGVGQVDAYIKRFNLGTVLPTTASPKLISVMDGWYRVNADKMNRMGATLIKSGMTSYVNTVEQATANLLTGTMTGRQAIAKASASLTNDGLKGFIDKAGRTWSPEAYSQMLVRTTANNSRREAQQARMEDNGLDLVEITSPAGARPGCAPYQGKIYSLSGNDTDYPALSSTSYGEVDGLFGINCGHDMIPYKKGTKRTYEPYPVKENEKVYKESQQQRQLERNIRHDKRQAVLANSRGETEQAKYYQDRVKEKQSKMREFIDQTDRTRRYDREQVY